MRLSLLYQHLDHLVIVFRDSVFLLEVLPQLHQALLDLFIVGPLQGVKDGRSNQEIREGHDDQGQGPDLEISDNLLCDNTIQTKLTFLLFMILTISHEVFVLQELGLHVCL